MFLETTESTLSQLGESLIRVKELALQAANDTNGGEPRRMIAAEIRQIYDSVVEMGNRRSGDRYIFAGHQTLTQPFSADGSYHGDSGLIQIQNHKGEFTPMNISGNQIFLGEDLSFQETINRDNYSPKTIEELQAFKLSQIEKDLNKFTTDLDPQQEKAEALDRGPASVGRIRTLEEQESLAEANGEESDVMATQNPKSGVNIFNLVKNLEAALSSNDKIGIQDSLEPLDQALNQINMARAEIGGRVNQLNATSDGIQKNIVDNKAANSQLEDADLFQVISDLNKTDGTLKATLETSSKILNQSLLDFLK